MDACDFTPVKTCTKCKVCKPLSEFDRSNTTKAGYCARCKACASEYNRRRYEENKEAIKARGIAWYAANKARMKVAKAAYCAANAETVAAKKAAWRAENKERVSSAKVAWKKANPDSYINYYQRNKERLRVIRAIWRDANRDRAQEYRSNRRARKSETLGSLSKGLSQRLFSLQRGLCPCCKLPLGEDYHMDHIVPLALGGTNTDENMQLLRAVCNLRKNAKHPIDYMQSKGFLL